MKYIVVCLWNNHYHCSSIHSKTWNQSILFSPPLSYRDCKYMSLKRRSCMLWNDFWDIVYSQTLLFGSVSYLLGIWYLMLSTPDFPLHSNKIKSKTSLSVYVCGKWKVSYPCYSGFTISTQFTCDSYAQMISWML